MSNAGVSLSVTGHGQTPKQRTIAKSSTPHWWHDSTKTVFGNPGAIHRSRMASPRAGSSVHDTAATIIEKHKREGTAGDIETGEVAAWAGGRSRALHHRARTGYASLQGHRE